MVATINVPVSEDLKKKFEDALRSEDKKMATQIRKWIEAYVKRKAREKEGDE